MSVINCTIVYISKYKILFSPEKNSSAILYKFFDAFKNKLFVEHEYNSKQ